MRKKHVLTQLIIILVASFLTMACGGGDALEKDTTSSSPVEETTASIVLPTIDFSLPETISNEDKQRKLEIAGFSDSTTVIEFWASRMDRIIDKINSILTRLNAQAVEGTGSFTGKGNDGLMSGTISELSGDPTYKYEALICYNDVGFLSIKWSDDNNRVEATRDFNITPLNRVTATNLLTRVLYTAAESTTVEVTAHGTAWNRPARLTNEDQMTHYIYGDKTSDETITLRGVQDWYETVPDSFTGDSYLTGKIEADNSGEFVGYRSFHEQCSDTVFDEDAVTGASWCAGRAIGSSTRYTDEERSTAWERLQTIGIAQQSNLAVVSLNSSLSCP